MPDIAKKIAVGTGTYFGLASLSNLASSDKTPEMVKSVLTDYVPGLSGISFARVDDIRNSGAALGTISEFMQYSPEVNTTFEFGSQPAAYNAALIPSGHSQAGMGWVDPDASMNVLLGN